MATSRRFTMSTTDLTEESNKMKELFLKTMLQEGHITEEQHKEMNRYCLIVAEKTFFGKLWDGLLWKNDPESVHIIVVKVLE